MGQNSVINKIKRAQEPQQTSEFEAVGTTKEELVNRIKDLEARVQALESA